MLEGEQLGDHPAHRGAGDVGGRDPEDVEEARGVGGHVAQRISATVLDLGREPDVPVVEADDLETTPGDLLAEPIAPAQQLGAEPADQENRGQRSVAEDLVLELERADPGARRPGPLAVAERRDVGGSRHSGGGPVADGRRDLLGQLGADVADGPEPLDGCGHVRLRQDVPGGVVVDVDLQDVRVGREADEDEDTADRQLESLAVAVVADRGDLAVADDLLDLRVQHEVDLLVRPRAVLKDGLGPELVPPVDDVDLARVAGQEVPLLEGGVTAADDGKDLVLEEGAVANGAVGNAATRQLFFAGDLQLPGQAAGGHDHRRCPQHAAGVEGHDLLVTVDVDRGDRLVFAGVEAELAGVLRHLEGQVGAEDRLDARVVLDQLGVVELPTQRPAVDQDRAKVHPGGVEPGRQAGGAAPHDDDVEVLDHATRTR